MSNEVNDLRNLIERFETARAQGDKEALDALNDEVRPCVNAAMTAVREGRLDAAPVRDATERLQSLAGAIAVDAEAERDAVAQELKGVRRNQSAVKAYGTVERK
ncbi:hypothetical protein C8D92_101454 [Tamilnaduibacter salinus]|uniref:Uncharacterized protein n=1 Tax=Tamilnaduibacter salinus TaxID=1484056 RepID=A0A2A2I3I7_9GAMM|nr:hypothetical protein [Tamilnaduibacter salinus]PAV25685.1 hypothetical protein CF392_09565 [Tamilnaduibacter salinus]PVY79241.1 hypothetical protein C8D92_101454 [Tamilnaduibacter salinus]